jgi:type IV pilus assembly protein PilM
MGFIDSITGALGSITGSLPGGSKRGSALGIDFGSTTLKVVQIRKEAGRAVLETYGALGLGPYTREPVGVATVLSKDALVQALKDLLKEANCTATRAGVSVPHSASLSTVIELPKMSNEQLTRAIPLEARKYIPVPLSDVMLDWFVIPHDEVFSPDTGKQDAQKDTVSILLVAIRNDALNGYQSILDGAGITPLFYELEVFSGARSSVGHTLAPVMFIDIGGGTTKVSIIENGIVRASHVISLGGQDMTRSISRALNLDFVKAEQLKRETGLTVIHGLADSQAVRTALLSTLGRIFPDAHKVLLEYGRKFQKNVGSAVLVGGGSTLKGLLPEAHDRLGVDVKIATPFAHTEAPAFLQDVLTEVGPEFATAVGAALRAIED